MDQGTRRKESQNIQYGKRQRHQASNKALTECRLVLKLTSAFRFDSDAQRVRSCAHPLHPTARESRKSVVIFKNAKRALQFETLSTQVSFSRHIKTKAARLTSKRKERGSGVQIAIRLRFQIRPSAEGIAIC